MKKENSTNLQKYSEMETKEMELVQLIRQLKDYVILDKKDYEKLVQNNKSTGCNESALEARDAQITLLQRQLARQEEYTTYWKDKYGECLNKLKKETTRWWRF